MEEVISAIATAQGRGGVAIIRMSGRGALDVAKKMFSRKAEFAPNTMYAGEIDCGDFGDYGMCVYFRAPKSFTGEDDVEFHCHGGTEIARGVLARTLFFGARLAERGEFTKRAFLNGKLSLSAAEGMADMIDAESQAQVRAGYSLYTERLTEEGKRLQGLIKTCLAGVEADIDYPEEDLNASSRAETVRGLREVRASLGKLIEQYRCGRKIKAGVNVALCGRPNAGKSSLLNALLGYDRAIVSSVPGTTRDSVEGTLEIGGVRFNLTDTAGIRAGADEIEREGIRRAGNAIRSADLIVYLKEEGDGDFGFPAGTPVIVVGAKCDLGKKSGCDLALSALTGEGIAELKRLMFERGYGRENDVFVLEERHYRAAKAACEAADEALAAAEGGLPPELYAEGMRRVWHELGSFSGETASEAVIAEIFEKFCVGK